MSAAPDVIWLGGWLCYPAHWGQFGKPPVDTYVRLFEILGVQWSVNIEKQDPDLTFEQEMSSLDYGFGDIEEFVERLFRPHPGRALGTIAEAPDEDRPDRYRLERPALPDIEIRVFRINVTLEGPMIDNATRETLFQLQIMGHKT